MQHAVSCTTEFVNIVTNITINLVLLFRKDCHKDCNTDSVYKTSLILYQTLYNFKLNLDQMFNLLDCTTCSLTFCSICTDCTGCMNCNVVTN